jgi:hypothetical protein
VLIAGRARCRKEFALNITQGRDAQTVRAVNSNIHASIAICPTLSPSVLNQSNIPFAFIAVSPGQAHPRHQPPPTNPNSPPINQTQPNPITRPAQAPLPTPVKVDRLDHWLQGYEPTLRDYIVNGFLYGFDIGFIGEVSIVESQNMKSARDRPDIVDNKLAKEIEAGRISGPHFHQPFTDFQSSR